MTIIITVLYDMHLINVPDARWYQKTTMCGMVDKEGQEGTACEAPKVDCVSSYEKMERNQYIFVFYHLVPFSKNIG